MKVHSLQVWGHSWLESVHPSVVLVLCLHDNCAMFTMNIFFALKLPKASSFSVTSKQKEALHDRCSMKIQLRPTPTPHASGMSATKASLAGRQGRYILVSQVEEVLDKTAGWQTLLRLPLWHCGICFITVASVLAVLASHETARDLWDTADVCVFMQLAQVDAAARMF